MRKDKDTYEEKDEIVPEQTTLNPETGKRKWKVGDIGRLLWSCIVAVFNGKFILKLKIDKYFPQIAWTFLLFALMILFSMCVDTTLTKVEANKKELQELQILHTQKSYEFVKLGRRSNLGTMLEEAGSKVTEPEKPAIILE